MRKGIPTNNSFILRNSDTWISRYKFSSVDCLIKHNITCCLIVVFTDIKCHCHFFKRCISGTFTDTIHSSFNTASTIFNSCKCVSYSHTKVIVTVRTKDNFTIWFNIFNEIFENMTELFRSCKTHCIRNINISRTGINCCLNNFQEIIELCTSSIFRWKLNNIKTFTRISHMFFDNLKNFFFWFLQLKFTMNRTCCNKDMTLWEFCILNSFITSINIRLYRTSQTRNCCSSHSSWNLFYSLKWIWTSCRETSFDWRNSPFFKLLCNSNFFFDWEVNTWCLFPISKACIKKLHFTHRQSSF